MDEMNKTVELTEEQIEGASGGNWQPKGCKGWVVGQTYRQSACSSRKYTCNVYVTAYGDTLGQIAYSLSDGNYMNLAKFNGIPKPDYIQVNQTIYVPIGSYIP